MTITFNPWTVTRWAVFCAGLAASIYYVTDANVGRRNAETRLRHAETRSATDRDALKKESASRRTLQILVSEKGLELAQLKAESSRLRRELEIAETQVRALSALKRENQ